MVEGLQAALILAMAISVRPYWSRMVIVLRYGMYV